MTIAFLAYAITDDVNGPRWLGIVDAARAQGVNLISVNGGLVNFRQETFEPANLLYEILSSEFLDGTLIGSVLREDLASPEDIERFCQRLPAPIVGLRPDFPGIAHIPLDNYAGMLEAVQHLIEAHHCRRIAFLRGPAGHSYAEARYRAYIDALTQHDLPVDPDLITPSSDWAVPSIHILLDERNLRPGQDFDAVVAANDTIKACNTLEILAERGVRVPGDVAVVGFDDVREDELQRPPLTSVRIPFYEQGRQAAILLLNTIGGKQNSPPASLPAQLIIRQSCGCLEPSVMHAWAELPTTPDNTCSRSALHQRKNEIVQTIVQSADCAAATQTQLDMLFDAFWADVQGESSGTCVAAWNELFLRILHTTGGLADWYNVVSDFRRAMLPYLLGDARLVHAENLWGQVHVLIGEYIRREQELRQFRHMQQQRILRKLEQDMMTTFDIADLMDILAQELPQLGIPSCYLALYDDDGVPPTSLHPPQWARLRLAYTEQGRVDLGAEGRRFQTQQIIPETLLPQHRSWQLHMEALSFRGSPLGVILFEMGPREAEIYDLLRIQISTALQGILLMQRIREHSMELNVANTELQNFAYVVSHDLKAPLRGIASLAHWIREDYSEHFDKEGREMVELLIGRTKRLDGLIDGILQYSRVGRTHTEEMPVDLDQLVRTVAESLSDSPNIHIELQGTFPVIHCNPTRLTQVFQNLISNAVKFLDKPQGRITVMCRQQEDVWLFSIADNGPGIETRYHEKIFKIFQILAPRDQRENTGIGLAIVKKIIAFYNGKIWVESTVGEGSTFFFTLPKT